MAGINFIGSFSGIDGTMIDQLMEAEKIPLLQLSNKKVGLGEKQDAWKDINTRLNSLFGKIKNLESSETFSSKRSTSSNDKMVTMSPSKNAATGKYKINIEKLATNTNIVGSQILVGDQDNSTELELTGSFSIKNKEGKEVNILLEKEDSLKSIVEKINAGTKDQYDADGKRIKDSATGITASIIDGRIVLEDEKTGLREIQLIGDGKGSLVNLGLSGGLRREEKGQDAKFTINGIEVESTSNEVKNIVEGLTINLHKEHDLGEYDTINIAFDSEKTTKAVQEFVDQYNSTIQFIEDKLKAGDPKLPGSKGSLNGDSSLMRLHSNLRNLVTSTVSKEPGSVGDFSQMGVSTIDKHGKLKFDSAKFNEVLLDDPKKVVGFFSGVKGVQGSGFVPRINDYIDSFVSKSNGIIKSKTESYDRSLKDLNLQIDNFNDRMERKEQYYIRMFSALDVAMMKAESQMSWLEGQVNAMNNVKK